MRTIKAVYLFELHKFLHSSRLVTPFVLLMAYLGYAYSSAPVNIVSSFSLCSLMVFLLMLIVGIRFDDINYNRIEETIIIKIKKKEKFYIAKVILLASIALFYSFISTFLPLVISAFYQLFTKLPLFSRAPAATDLLSGFSMFFLTGLAGGMGGLFLNPKIIRKKELIVLLNIIYGFVTVVKGPFVASFPVMKLFAWLLPPVYDLSVAYGREKFFSLQNTGIMFCFIISYLIVEIIIYIKIMAKRGFDEEWKD